MTLRSRLQAAFALWTTLPLVGFGAVILGFGLGERERAIAIGALVVALVLSLLCSAVVLRRIRQLHHELISIVSHELRTPLTSVHGALSLLRAGAGNARRESLLELAYRNSERLSRLVDDLLDLRRLELGRLKLDRRPVALRGIVEESVETLRGQAAELQVEVRVGEIPELRLEVDADRLVQVTTGLLSNALKHSPQGEQVRIDARSGNGRVRLSVTNHGPAIPAGYRATVFERFGLVDPSDCRHHQSGTGLGLALAKEIVELHGGSIDYSCDAVGTTFFFELPA